MNRIVRRKPWHGPSDRRTAAHQGEDRDHVGVQRPGFPIAFGQSLRDPGQGRFEQVLRQHGSKVIQTEPETGIVKVDQRKPGRADKDILAQHVGMDQPEASLGCVAPQPVAQKVPRSAQQGCICRLQGRMVPEAAPERCFAQQPVTVPPRAHEIRRRHQGIGGGVHLGKQPAKGAVTPDLLFHIARKGNAGLAQRHAVHPGDGRGKAACRQSHQKLPVQCRNRPGHRHARPGQRVAPPQFRPDGCGGLVARPVQPQRRAPGWQHHVIDRVFTVADQPGRRSAKGPRGFFRLGHRRTSASACTIFPIRRARRCLRPSVIPPPPAGRGPPSPLPARPSRQAAASGCPK